MMQALPQSNLPIDWIKNLSDEQSKKDFELILRNSTTVTTRIVELLQERLKTLESKQLDPVGYDKASWAYKQADYIGSKREIMHFLSLFNYLKGV